MGGSWGRGRVEEWIAVSVTQSGGPGSRREEGHCPVRLGSSDDQV